jgi:polo-like kinase 1
MAVTGNNNMAATMATTGGAAGEMGTLESIHHNLATVMASIDKDAVSTTTTTTKPPHFHATQQTDKPATWVTQYVDYTSKYGLGYLLADGSTGVYFNDSTKIVLAPGGGALTSAGDKQGVDESELRFQYMERVRSSTEGGEHKSTAAAATERFETHTLGSYPPSLHKKVTLLQHFRDYLVSCRRSLQCHLSQTLLKSSVNNSTCCLTHVSFCCIFLFAVF